MWMDEPVGQPCSEWFTFIIVYDLPLVALCHLVRINTSVLDVTLNGDIAITLIGDNLQEGRASRAWAT